MTPDEKAAVIQARNRARQAWNAEVLRFADVANRGPIAGAKLMEHASRLADVFNELMLVLDEVEA